MLENTGIDAILKPAVDVADVDELRFLDRQICKKTMKNDRCCISMVYRKIVVPALHHM